MTKHDFTFKNRNGKRIHGTVRHPTLSGKKQPTGTIILLHGLGGWKEQPLVVIIGDTLCHDGYQVVTFDAADGAKGPDADFFMSTTSGFLDDLDDVVEYVTHEEWYKAPLMLVGHSLGGTISIQYARLNPSKVSKLIVAAPPVSWKKVGALPMIGGLWWLARNKNKTPGPNHSKLPLDRGWVLDFMKFNGKRDAPYIAAPTLIVSASRDSSAMSPKAHYSLATRFPNATNIVIPGAGHVFWKHERKLADTIVQWLSSS
jgi:pimeloyl-ACP methyl ester carboxylesterase